MVENHHSFDFFNAADPSEIFRVELRDGDVFHVRACAAIDASVYGFPDGWFGTIVDFQSSDSWRMRLFRPGGGVDFYEADVLEIRRSVGDELLFLAP